VVAAFAEGSPSPSPAVVLPDDPQGYAAQLYAALHQLDDTGCDAILVVEVPDDPGWAAIRDRLRRGSA
jgi:L-threonylcarbamoyladenylate synthase